MMRRAATVWLGAWLGAGCAGPPTHADALEARWACDVLLGREAGDARDALVRWRQPVRYLIVGAGPAARQAVAAAFLQLRAALAGVHDVALEFAGADDARAGDDGFVSVFFVAPHAAGALAARFGLAPAVDADGWFRIDWNERFELTRGIVLIDPDLDDRWLRHTALEELFQVLGPGNDSALLTDSVVYDGAGARGSRATLSPADRQLLTLLYRDLEPGDRAAEVLAAMRRSRRAAAE